MKKTLLLTIFFSLLFFYSFGQSPHIDFPVYGYKLYVS